MERKKLIQAGAFTLASIGVAFAVREAVDYIDSWATPKYVLKGNPAPPMDEPPPWTPRTDWVRSNRIVFVDGRDGKTIRP